MQFREIKKPSYLPTRVMFREGGLESLADALRKIGSKNALLVTGEGSMRRAGITQRIEKMLRGTGIELSLFETVPSNPTAEVVQQAADRFRGKGIDAVVGLGGGSAMDAAKCTSFLLKNDGSIYDYLQGKREAEVPALPIVAIPTTSGTGAEVTQWATVWGKGPSGELKKFSLKRESMFPSIAIVDPVLTASMPTGVTASTGADAFSQAIEAFWSKYSTKESDAWAVRAMKLVIRNLEKATKQPNNRAARKSMALGALYAGFAFTKTATTACHSVSYPLTARFGIPHGEACMLTVPSFLLYNCGLPKMKAKLDRLAGQLGYGNAQRLAAGLKTMSRRIGLRTTFSEMGIGRNDISWILDNAFTPERMGNNPRLVERKDLQRILEGIYSPRKAVPIGQRQGPRAPVPRRPVRRRKP